MFTGIVETTGTIESVARMAGKWEFTIRTSALEGGIGEGDSIAIDGVCLTATRTGGNSFTADASLETLKVTTLKEKRSGSRVNIERALRADGRLGGHLVMGHVDAVGRITDLGKAGDSVRITVEVPREISKYIVEKGSIAVDGISLTVNDQRDNRFTVNVIPYTLSDTTLADKALGDFVNIETDIIGKYVERFVSKSTDRGINFDFLVQHGYAKGE
jgi:riboflavin synthase